MNFYFVHIILCNFVRNKNFKYVLNFKWLPRCGQETGFRFKFVRVWNLFSLGALFKKIQNYKSLKGSQITQNAEKITHYWLIAW